MREAFIDQTFALGDSSFPLLQLAFHLLHLSFQVFKPLLGSTFGAFLLSFGF